MDYKTLIVEKNKHAGVITLNRPDAMNALNSKLVAELSQALRCFEKDDEVGAVVITGNEKLFAAGADIKEMAGKTYMQAYKENFITDGWEEITKCRKPIIAAVAGYALGGGCELAMMCDMIIAGSNAKFGQPEITVGIIPGAGGTQRLVRAVGKAKAMEMCLTGRQMTAEEAEKVGLVSRIVEPDELLKEAVKVANKIADMSGPMAMMIKECVNKSFEVSLAEGVSFERRQFHSCFATEDQKEGMNAFIEKRQPNFKNK